MRSPYYGQLGSLTHHPDVGVIWRTRDEEPEPCKPWGWSDEYIDDPEERFLVRDFMRRVCQTELTPQQEEVIVARFGEQLTLEEVGQQMNLNRERIRQIEAKALRRLRSRGYLMELKAREDLEHRKSAPSPFLVLSDPCAVTGPNREVLTTGTMEQCLQWMRGRSDCVLVIKD